MKKNGTFTKSMLTGLAVLMLVGIGGWLVRGSSAFYRQDGTVNFAALKSSNNNGALTAQMWDSLIDGIIALDAKVASAPSSGGSQGGGGGTEETPSPSGPIPEECFYVDQSGTLRKYGFYGSWENYDFWRDRYPRREDFEEKVKTCSGTIYNRSSEPWDFVIPAKVRNRPIREIALEYHRNFRIFPRSIVVPDSVRVITSLSSLNFDATRKESSIALQLGKGVERIGKGAFQFLPLDSLVIPDSVKVIEQGAFFNSHVRSLVLGTGLHTIGDGAFIGHSLSSLVIPDTVKRIGKAAFMPQNSNTTSLVYLKIGKGIKEIPSAAFVANESLVTLQLAEGLETIGTGAFANTALTQVDLPSSLKQIQIGAFFKEPSSSTYGLIDYYDDPFAGKIADYHFSSRSYNNQVRVIGYLKKPITEVSNTPEQTNIRLEQVP